MKRFFSLYIIICLAAVPLILSACGIGISSEEERYNNLQNAIQHEEFLLSQMQSISKKYAITDRNPSEIVLTNYALGNISIYDKHGNAIRGFGINNATIYHNWYSLSARDNGIVHIEMETVTRTRQNEFFNSKKTSLHDRSLTINLEPYTGLSFASLNGEKSGTLGYRFENSTEILYPVVTNTTEFAMTRIISRGELGWNTSHTMQHRTFVISYMKIIFEDTTYSNATIMEYRFSAFTWNPYNLDSVYEYGEVL